MLRKPIDYWNNVIYCYESKFNLLSSDSQVMIWRQPNKELDGRNLEATVKPRLHKRLSHSELVVV